MKFILLWIPVVALSIVASCGPQATTDRSATLRRGSVPEMTAYTLSEAFSVVTYESVQHALASAPPDRSVSLSSLKTLWAAHSVERVLRNSAVAVGFPAQCPTTYHQAGTPTPYVAAAGAMTRCLESQIGLAEHLEGRCGCRLALINDVLVVPPETLNHLLRTPAIVRSRKLGDAPVLGTAVVDGRAGDNRDISLLDRGGSEFCRGRYSMSVSDAFTGSGAINLDCSNSLRRVTGSFSVTNAPTWHGRTTIAVVRGSDADGDPVTIVVGITNERAKSLEQLQVLSLWGN